MKFRSPNRSILEFDIRNALSLTPPSCSVELTQSRKLADTAANCERLYVRYVAADLENTDGHSINGLPRGDPTEETAMLRGLLPECDGGPRPTRET